MPLGVLGGVEEEAEHRRGELETADAPRLQELGLVRLAELAEGAVDLPFESGDEDVARRVLENLVFVP